jgi:uncharacterized protein
MKRRLVAEKATGSDQLPAGVTIPQYSRRAILAVWAAAAGPMGILAWVVAPLVSEVLGGTQPLSRALIICLTIGLFWQFVLVLVLVGIEQRSLRWSTLRQALWLQSPRSPRTGRVGGWLWLLTIPFVLAFGVEELIPTFSGPADRDFGAWLDSDAGGAFLDGAWGWFALIIAMLVFNTVLGEELLFRGFLLPRMSGAFGRYDWVANGVLFAIYHVHLPWVIPVALLDTLILSYPSRRYRSAWFGIIVHSAQSVFLAILLFALVLS